MIITAELGKITKSIDFSDTDMIRGLITLLDNCCYCNFDSLKPELEKLKALIDKRWNEPVDVSCIE